MSESVPERPARPPRTDTREVVELRAIRQAQPELADAVDLHLELIEMRRRVQGRVPLPSFDLNATAMTWHQEQGRPVLRFEDIPMDMTNLRLMVRQAADVLRRHQAIDLDEHREVEALGRDVRLLDCARAWYQSVTGHASGTSQPPPTSEAVGQVLTIAMRPFLARCAEVLRQSPYLATWTRSTCPLCGGEPDLSVITASGERHLLCGRCGMRWDFDPVCCPYCANEVQGTMPSFSTRDGKYRVTACDACRRYLKAVDERRTGRPVLPVVDSVATLPLDAAAMQRGYHP